MTPSTPYNLDYGWQSTFNAYEEEDREDEEID